MMDKAIIPILTMVSIFVFVSISALGSAVAYPSYLMNYRYWNPPYAPYYGGMNPWLGLGAGGWMIPSHNNIIYPGHGMPMPVPMPMPPVIPPIIHVPVTKSNNTTNTSTRIRRGKWPEWSEC